MFNHIGDSYLVCLLFDVVFLVDACGMARCGFQLAAEGVMPGFAPAGESLSLLTKKGTQRNHPGESSKAR
ncbi:hypothetical protein [Rheinheimera sp. 4Y26]|uniref:hypothetical protein n=1 Tax=Rheinheimera sp. 4Y26 TaxID=2977811 RepID=UPI0021B14C10|nr:hypothetical protein [Rheinheimera sp. 4Y26]MCT6701279.1 hypothetical protein [Rheinheimera sp. 4Y26]